MALSDDYPALKQLVQAPSPVGALSAAQANAIQTDAKAAWTRLQRFLDSQPYGPGYAKGYAEGQTAAATGGQAQAKLDVLVNAAVQLCAEVEQFDFDTFTPDQLVHLQAICQGVRDALP